MHICGQKRLSHFGGPASDGDAAFASQINILLRERVVELSMFTYSSLPVDAPICNGQAWPMREEAALKAPSSLLSMAMLDLEAFKTSATSLGPNAISRTKPSSAVPDFDLLKDIDDMVPHDVNSELDLQAILDASTLLMIKRAKSMSFLLPAI